MVQLKKSNAVDFDILVNIKVTFPTNKELLFNLNLSCKIKRFIDFFGIATWSKLFVFSMIGHLYGILVKVGPSS